MTTPRPIPALLGALLLAVLLALGTGVAVSAPPLPQISATELVTSMLEAQATPPPVSGELAATLGLGLPALPDDDTDGGLADLLGENRLRIERSSDGLRAALLGSRSERVFVTDGDTAALWDSRTLEATRFELPDEQRAEPHPAPADPQALAARLVEGAQKRAALSVDGTARVAGRDAYRLEILPEDPATTLGRVDIDVDAEQRVALRVGLFARGADQASVEVAWTRVSFDPIDPQTFAFTPPPGSTVTDKSWPDHAEKDLGLAALAGAEGTRLVGEGLSAVAVLPLPEGSEAGGAEGLLPLDGPLLSARVAAADGQRVLLAGLVPLARLDEVAAELR